MAEEPRDGAALFLNPNIENPQKQSALPVTNRNPIVPAVPTADLKADPPAGVPDPRADPKATAELAKGTLVTLDQCVEIAILNNLGLKISRINDRQSDIRVREAWAQYLPEFNVGTNHTQQRLSGDKNSNPSTQFNAGLIQRSPIGTTFRFAVDETRPSFSNSRQGSGGLSFNVDQPLWKGAGLDVGLAEIRSTRIQRLISRGALELDTQNLIFSVRQAYSEIIRQIQNRDVNLQSIKSARKFLELTDARYKAGQVTQLEVFNAEVQLRSRELDLITTERSLENGFDQLKQFMDVNLEDPIRVDAPVVDFGEFVEPGLIKELRSDDIAGTVKLFIIRDGKPATEPKVLYQATRYDETIILQEALQSRIELLNQRRTLAIQKLNTLVTKDGLGHSINLTAGFDRNHNGRSVFEGDVGGESNAVNIGVNANFPWGKVRDRASYERELLNLQVNEINLKRVHTQVQAEVRDIMRALREGERSLLIEGKRVEQAKRAVEAAQISFDRGLKSSFDVIRAEDDLLQAKVTFINRSLSYVVLQARLELVVGKPTGRVDIAGRSVGGLIDARMPEGTLPNSQPDATPSEQENPHNKNPEYRKDYKPSKKSPVIVDE